MYKDLYNCMMVYYVRIYVACIELHDRIHARNPQAETDVNLVHPSGC